MILSTYRENLRGPRGARVRPNSICSGGSRSPQEINGPTERGDPSWWMRAVSRILWATGPSIKTIRMVTAYIRADVGSFS